MLKDDLKNLLAEFEDLTNSKAVLGEPVCVGPVTLVPVMSLKVGIGTYGYKETQNGGGGVNVEPRAVVVIQDNEVSIYSFSQKDTIDKLTEMVPELNQLWEKGSYGNM